MVASRFSGATEISGALIDCSESFCGQSKEDWVWFTGNSGVAIKHRKPINPAMIAVQRSPAGAVAILSPEGRASFDFVLRLSDTAISVRQSGPSSRVHAPITPGKCG